jgi:hypothetical protein
VTAQPILDRALGLWATLAGSGAAFCREHEADAVSAPTSGLCPPGWVGIVRLADRLLVTVPTAELRTPVQDAVNRLDLDVCTDPAALSEVLDVAETLGPASLGYLDGNELAVIDQADVVRRPANDPALKRLRLGVTKAEAAESGTARITSEAFVVRAGREVVAAAGYERWPGGTAHLLVLVATGHRGRGLATATAAAAVSAALEEGLLPQWRATSDESRRVAAKLGFREMGSQLSLRLR